MTVLRPSWAGPLWGRGRRGWREQPRELNQRSEHITSAVISTTVDREKMGGISMGSARTRAVLSLGSLKSIKNIILDVYQGASDAKSNTSRLNAIFPEVAVYAGGQEEVFLWFLPVALIMVLWKFWSCSGESLQD